MNKNQFIDFVLRAREEYGVNCYLDNEEDIEEGSLWFECPECYEPILYEDWYDFEELNHALCPICGMKLFV